jgi:hypothetical protein
VILLASNSAVSASALLDGIVGVVIGALIGVFGGMRIEKQRDRNEREAEQARDKATLAGAAIALADRMNNRCITLKTIDKSWTPNETLRLDADDELRVLAQFNPAAWKTAREAETSLENVWARAQNFAADAANSKVLINSAIQRLQAAETALRSIT